MTTGKSALNRVLGRLKGRLSSPEVSDDGGAVPEIYLGVQDEEICLKQQLKLLYGIGSLGTSQSSSCQPVSFLVTPDFNVGVILERG